MEPQLRKIYAMALIAKLPQGFTSIVTPNGEIVPFPGLTMHPDFEEIIEQDHITALQAYYNNRQSVNIKGFQKTVSEFLTYKDRKAIIERKSAEFRAAAAKDIQALRLKIAALRTAKFNELFRANSEDIEELFDAFGDNTDLVRFLVLEGFLDDTYYQYTSLFHRGRLSPSDNKFLIQIRSFKTPDPDFQIDNPKEVIAAMRDDDFRQKFVLNTTLVDCLLGDSEQYRSQMVKLIDYVSSNFDECDTFFSAYYQTGQRNSELLTTLVNRWPGFVSAAIAAPQNAVHVARMIAHLPARVLEALARKSTEISDYLASNLASVLALQVDFEPSRLAIFQFETEDLDSVGPYPATVRVLSDYGLYTITAENVGFIFRNVLGSGGAADLETKHYSTILRAQYAPLIDKVHSDFDRYLKGVLLRPSNSEEDVSVILDVLNHEEIDPEFLEQFLEQQGAKLPTLERVPARLRSAVFRLSRIEPSWENCLTYLSSEEFDAQTLTAYLEKAEVRSILSQIPVGGQNEARPLRLFLFNNDDFDIDSFRAYLRRLPRKFDQFSETVREEKLRVLVEEEAVTFSEKAFSFLAGKEALQVQFVAKNIDSFLTNEDKYSVNDDFREKLLDSAIGDEQKLKVIDKMDLTALGVSAHRASLVGHIIHRTDANVSSLPAEAAFAMVINLEPAEIQIAMLNRCQKLMSDDQVRAVIQQLPKPYSEIEPGWKQPTIPNTPENQELVRWLQSRSIISSSKLTVSFFSDAEIRIFNFRK